MPSGKFQPEPGNYVELQVADSGEGINAEIMDRIFDPFFTTKELGRGTGLGLASVFGIIKGHSGYIDVASQPGQGTTFSLYFPTVHQAPVETQKARREITPVKGSVLVVDDEHMVLETSARMLVKLGFTVHPAGGGREAIEIFRQKAHELDLVVLDMVMPGIGGEEVYRQIKEMRPDARVLISSGFRIQRQDDRRSSTRTATAFCASRSAWGSFQKRFRSCCKKADPLQVGSGAYRAFGCRSQSSKRVGPRRGLSPGVRL